MNSKGSHQHPRHLASFEFKRAIVGGLSMFCLLLAGAIYFASPDLNNVLLATAVRIGIVLLAIWLAMPQLKGLLAKLPEVMPVVLLVLVVLCAARPSLFRLIGSLVIVASALLAISKWIKRLTQKG